MRLVVTGTSGQIVNALRERACYYGVCILALGRPALDLVYPHNIAAAIATARPDVVVNAAAFTNVEKAEREAVLARAINIGGAAAVAKAAHEIGVPIIQLSTDYVFDGTKAEPYREDDRINPSSVYGRSKAEGEAAVAAAGPNHAILRLAWIYSPFGRNFVTTILDHAQVRPELRIVADQFGNPTSALDVADGIISVAHNLVTNPNARALRGTFHMTSAGECTWADIAESVFAISKANGGPSAKVKRVTSADYPTAVTRPANSRLDCTRIANIHSVQLPLWHCSLERCVKRIVGIKFIDRR